MEWDRKNRNRCKQLEVSNYSNFYLYSPVFVKKILLTYKFEVVQKLKFCVYDADENAKAEDVNSIYLHLIQ